MDINNNILAFNKQFPASIQEALAGRVRMRRLEMDLTQRAMAARAGVTLATYRRFERSGEISLRNLVLVSAVIGMQDDFDSLFAETRYRNIDDVISQGARAKRKRGHTNE
jgi:transcriptional regulator with XRE-family HTH domain